MSHYRLLADAYPVYTEGNYDDFCQSSDQCATGLECKRPLTNQVGRCKPKDQPSTYWNASYVYNSVKGDNNYFPPTRAREDRICSVIIGNVRVPVNDSNCAQPSMNTIPSRDGGAWQSVRECDDGCETYYDERSGQNYTGRYTLAGTWQPCHPACTRRINKDPLRIYPGS